MFRYLLLTVLVKVLFSFVQVLMGFVQVWSEHFDLIGAGFPVPGEYEHLPFSLTYGDDVGKAVVSVLKKGFVAVLCLLCAYFVHILWLVYD